MTDTRTDSSMWTFRPEVGAPDLASTDITGFHVEALDGGIGKVDEATHEVGASEIVVDTGPWIFGKKVILPAGTIESIDPIEEKVYVHRTKDQIKHAPQLEEHATFDDIHRDRLSDYYSQSDAPRV